MIQGIPYKEGSRVAALTEADFATLHQQAAAGDNELRKKYLCAYMDSEFSNAPICSRETYQYLCADIIDNSPKKERYNVKLFFCAYFITRDQLADFTKLYGDIKTAAFSVDMLLQQLQLITTISGGQSYVIYNDTGRKVDLTEYVKSVELKQIKNRLARDKAVKQFKAMLLGRLQYLEAIGYSNLLPDFLLYLSEQVQAVVKNYDQIQPAETAVQRECRQFKKFVTASRERGDYGTNNYD